MAFACSATGRTRARSQAVLCAVPAGAASGNELKLTHNHHQESAMKALMLYAVTAVGLGACAGSGALPRPPAPFGDDAAAFVTTLGADTTALELFTIRGNTLEAEVVSRTPRTSVRRVRMS